MNSLSASLCLGATQTHSQPAFETEYSLEHVRLNDELGIACVIDSWARILRSTLP